MIESEYQTWFIDTLHLENASCLSEYYPLLWFKPFTKKQVIFLLKCYLSQSSSSSMSQQGTGMGGVIALFTHAVPCYIDIGFIMWSRWALFLLEHSKALWASNVLSFFSASQGICLYSGVPISNFWNISNILNLYV